MLLSRRLLTDEHASNVGSELFPLLIEHPQEPILPCRLPTMIPFFGVSHNLVLIVCLDGQKRVYGLSQHSKSAECISSLCLRTRAHLCRLGRRRIAEVSDVLVDEDGARRDGRRILKQAELGNVRAREKLDEPVELGSDGLDAFRKADRVVEDRVGGVYLICFLPGAISERGPHTKAVIWEDT